MKDVLNGSIDHLNVVFTSDQRDGNEVGLVCFPRFFGVDLVDGSFSEEKWDLADNEQPALMV